MTADGFLIYDADCGFCTRSARWISGDNAHFSIRPWQSLADLGQLGLSVEDVSAAAYWVAADGRLWRGAEAIAQSLIARGGILSTAGHVILLRPVKPAARFVYGKIAFNRHRMPGGTPTCRVDQRPAD